MDRQPAEEPKIAVDEHETAKDEKANAPVGQAGIVTDDHHESLLPGPIDHDDVESALGIDDNFSGTTSLASTILRNRELWGRSYHKFRSGENDYWGPNDEQQNDALDIGHHMLTLALGGKLFLAPIDPSSVHQVLDVGTGTGIWAIDFADAHPNAQVTGVDLSPIQPNWVPPNCDFTIDDVEQEWTYQPDFFDFINIRCLMGSISDWPALYRQALHHLTPGGWIQHLDIDIQFRAEGDTMPPDHVMNKFSEIFFDIGRKTGKTFEVAQSSARLIRDAGFVDVHEQWIKLPIGTWPKDKHLKEIGTYNYYYCYEGCEGWSTYLLIHVLGWKIEEVQVFLAKMKAALRHSEHLNYFYISVVSARKPQ